jgi:hypothetical protein
VGMPHQCSTILRSFQKQSNNMELYQLGKQISGSLSHKALCGPVSQVIHVGSLFQKETIEQLSL